MNRKNYNRILLLASLCVVGWAGTLRAEVAAPWSEVFSDIPTDMSKWQSPEVYTLEEPGFSFRGGDADKNVQLYTEQTFPDGHSYILRASGISFATKFNNSSAHLIFGFARDRRLIPLGLKLTRFGDGCELVYNNQTFALSNRPYLEAGGVEIQLEYDAATYRVIVTQSKGKYKTKGGNTIKSAERSPVVLIEKTFTEPANMGVPLMIYGESKHNGGYVGKGLKISDISVQSQAVQAGSQ